MLKKLSWPILLSRYKAVVFDMDGVLFDTIGVWNEADRVTIRHFGGPDVDLLTIQKNRDAFFKEYHGSDGYTVYVQELIKTYNLSSQDAEAVKNFKWKMAGEILANLSFKPGVLKFIKALQEAGKMLALATNSTETQLKNLFVDNPNVSSKLGLGSFKVVLKKESCLRSKPKPDIYLEAANQLGLAPEDCLVVEDSLEGVQAAISAGTSVINVYDMYSDIYRAEIDQALQDAPVATYKVNRLDDIFKD